MSIKGTNAFDAAFNAARQDKTQQGYRVSYAEFKKGIEALKSDGGKIARSEFRHVAQTLASDPYLTAPARKEAYAILKQIGTGKLDATAIDAIKAEFSLRNGTPFKSLALPGREVKNTADLPDSVAKWAADVHDADSGEDWDSTEVRSATLAGQPVFLARHSWLGGDGDAEKLAVFSRDGKQIATGGIWDAMAGFSWD